MASHSCCPRDLTMNAKQKEEQQQHFLMVYAKPNYVGSFFRNVSTESVPIANRLPLSLGSESPSNCVWTNIPTSTSTQQDVLALEIERKNAIMALFWPHVQQHVSEIRPRSKDLEQTVKHSEIGEVCFVMGTCEEKTENMDNYIRSLGFDRSGVENARRFFKRYIANYNQGAVSAIYDPVTSGQTPQNNPTNWDWSCFLVEKLHDACCGVACKCCCVKSEGSGVAKAYDIVASPFLKPGVRLATLYESNRQCECDAKPYFTGVKLSSQGSKATLYGDTRRESSHLFRNTIFDIFRFAEESFDPSSSTDEGCNNIAERSALYEKKNDLKVVKHQEILCKIVSNMQYLEEKKDKREAFFIQNNGHSFGSSQIGALKIALDVWCWGFHKTISEKAIKNNNNNGKPSRTSPTILFMKPAYEDFLMDVSKYERYFGYLRCYNATQLGILSKASHFKFIKELYMNGAKSKKAQKLLTHSSHMVRYFSAETIRETYITTGKILCSKMRIDVKDLDDAVKTRWSEVSKILKKTCTKKLTLLVRIVSQSASSWSTYAKNGKYDIEQMLKWLSKTSNLVMSPELVNALLVAVESHEAGPTQQQ